MVRINEERDRAIWEARNAGLTYQKLSEQYHITRERCRQVYTSVNFRMAMQEVYRLLDKEKIEETVAEALYMGIVHDTGVFQYSCTSPDTLRAAADLLSRGINAPALIEHTFYEKTYAQNQILGRALLESIVFMDGACIFTSLTKAVMQFYGVTAKELEGIVSQLRVTKGVEVAIFMYELEPNVYKVSLRSKEKVDVSRIARYFGGGGHVRAAGFTMPGTVHDVINNLSKQIALQLGPKEKTKSEA